MGEGRGSRQGEIGEQGRELSMPILVFLPESSMYICTVCAHSAILMTGPSDATHTIKV